MSFTLFFTTPKKWKERKQDLSLLEQRCFGCVCVLNDWLSNSVWEKSVNMTMADEDGSGTVQNNRRKPNILVTGTPGMYV